MQKATFGSMGCRPRARQLGVQKGRQSQGLELLSRQCRKQRLAVWAAGRGPGSWECRRAGKVKVWSYFLGSAESNVWQYGLPAAGPAVGSAEGQAKSRFGAMVSSRCRK